ncbi:DNA mismatch endonuclease Vsr [Gordonia bronchialis]|nr:very short patch repair endonuclease [Gordonia bronchialis]QGS27134.1 DNA mismatch endonuclease Vsr [Gordonia bronchialis]
MAAVRRSETSPERAIRSVLHCRGFRYRKDYPIRVDGRLIRPDIVFTKKRVAVFVDGCFWHLCPLHGQIPATNTDFWRRKLERNAERDLEQTRALEGSGWTVVRVWEHVPTPTAVDTIVDSVHRA